MPYFVDLMLFLAKPIIFATKRDAGKEAERNDVIGKVPQVRFVKSDQHFLLGYMRCMAWSEIVPLCMSLFMTEFADVGAVGFVQRACCWYF
jgi:hypothetical protein